MEFRKVRADITKEISDARKKLRHMGNVRHDDNEGSRDIERSLADVSDVSMHVDSASRELGENPFELLFFLPDMHEETNDVVSSQPDMQKDTNDVLFPLPKAHPLTPMNTFSAFLPKQRACVLQQRALLLGQRSFVLKQRAFVLSPARAADNDDAVQRTAEAGGKHMARQPETCDPRILRRGRLTG